MRQFVPTCLVPSDAEEQACGIDVVLPPCFFNLIGVSASDQMREIEQNNGGCINGVNTLNKTKR